MRSDEKPWGGVRPERFTSRKVFPTKTSSHSGGFTEMAIAFPKCSIAEVRVAHFQRVGLRARKNPLRSAGDVFAGDFTVP